MKSLVLLLFFIQNVNCQAKEKEVIKFHKPETEAEKTLDLIFKIDDISLKQPLNIDDIKAVNIELYTFAKENPKILQHLLYNKMTELIFTKGLRDAIHRAHEIGRKSCQPGDLCPPNYNIVICSQDRPDPFLYETLYNFSSKNDIYITYQWHSGGL